MPAVAAGKKKFLTSLILANITVGSISVTVQIVRNGGAPVSNIVVGAPLPVGSALEVIINKPPVLNEGDTVRVKSNTADSVDATVSAAEV